ncbi:hypothetical protein ACFFOV_17880, partial [Cerasicoccus arenae]|uniref:hypothetical protein n=1 Tax=Cerasicoccus arenae TaxID=424488 RepID=UPI0035EB29DC
SPPPPPPPPWSGNVWLSCYSFRQGRRPRRSVGTRRIAAASPPIPAAVRRLRCPDFAKPPKTRICHWWP